MATWSATTLGRCLGRPLLRSVHWSICRARIGIRVKIKVRARLRVSAYSYLADRGLLRAALIHRPDGETEAHRRSSFMS